MASLEAQNPDFEGDVKATFDRQSFMRMIGAEITSIAAGTVEIAVPRSDHLLQHHGYFHGAVMAAVVDTACGCSAMTLMPAGSAPLTVEYKINFLAPAAGERLVARGRVLKAGRRLTVCSGDAVVEADGAEKLVATLVATMVGVAPK